MARRLVCALVLVAACSAPDVGPGVGEAARLLAETDRGLRPDITRQAAAELAAAERAALAEGKVVLDLAGDCDYTVARASGQAVSDCSLVEQARPVGGPVNATQMLDALDALRDYFTALAALADARSSDEVAARTRALMQAIGKLETGDDGALARIAAGARERTDLVQGMAGFVAGQARIAALRRVVRRADPVIGRMTDIAAAWLDERPGGLPGAQARLLDAQERMILTATTGTLADRAAATAEMRAAYAGFREAEASSPATRLLLVRRMHGAMAERLAGPGSAEDVLATLEEIRALLNLAEEEE